MPADAPIPSRRPFWASLLRSDCAPIEIRSKTFKIGRAKDNDLVLDNDTVFSNHHLTLSTQWDLVPTGSGTCRVKAYLTDTSTNGTLLNGRNMAKHTKVELEEDSTVELPLKQSSAVKSTFRLLLRRLSLTEADTLTTPVPARESRKRTRAVECASCETLEATLASAEAQLLAAETERNELRSRLGAASASLAEQSKLAVDAMGARVRAEAEARELAAALATSEAQCIAGESARRQAAEAQQRSEQHSRAQAQVAAAELDRRLGEAKADMDQARLLHVQALKDREAESQKAAGLAQELARVRDELADVAARLGGDVETWKQAEATRAQQLRQANEELERAVAANQSLEAGAAAARTELSAAHKQAARMRVELEHMGELQTLLERSNGLLEVERARGGELAEQVRLALGAVQDERQQVERLSRRSEESDKDWVALKHMIKGVLVNVVERNVPPDVEPAQLQSAMMEDTQPDESDDALLVAVHKGGSEVATTQQS